MPFQFSHVCQLLSSLEGVMTHDPPYTARRRSQELKRKTEYWFRCHRRTIDCGQVDRVALLSTLLPEKRTDRVYGLQEARLCKVISRCLHLSRGNVRILDDWRHPGHGGLGSCVEKVLKEFDCERKPGAAVTVEEVDMVLHGLASHCRFSGPTVRSLDISSSSDERLRHIFRRLNSSEGKWFTRLILKNYSPVELDYDHVISELHFLLPGLLRFQDSFTAAIALLRTSLSHYSSKPDLDIQRAGRTEASTHLRPAIGVKVGRQVFVKARSLQHCTNLCSNQAWSAERKYDGEYCEVHIDRTKGENSIQIFSKSNKDSTTDRQAVHAVLRNCLKLGESSCAFRNHCIVTGEIVVWSDQQQRILEFYHLRKHISRSGVFLGRDEDSQIKPGERLMIVLFDILVLDDEILLRKPYAERRKRLKEVIRCKPGHAITSERAIVDFRNRKEAQNQLCCQFAAALVNRCEGLVLKPLDMPYFRFDGDEEGDAKGFVIKLKKDYLQELGELRDVADFAVVGASYNPSLVHKSNICDLQFTTFHLGCCVNKEDSIRFQEAPQFRIMGTITIDQCIPHNELRALNEYVKLLKSLAYPQGDRTMLRNSLKFSFNQDSEMNVDFVFPEPCVVEVLGSGFVRLPNKDYKMLRHPRILKLHLDRGWQDACTFNELQVLTEDTGGAFEDRESQELSLLVGKFQNKLMRKAEREHSTQRSTPREDLQILSQTPERSQHMKVFGAPLLPTRRRSPRGNPTPVMVRLDSSERLPGDPELVSSDSTPANSRSSNAKDCPVIPPSSSTAGMLLDKHATKRSRSPLTVQQVKRTKRVALSHVSSLGATSLSLINQNAIPRRLGLSHKSISKSSKDETSRLRRPCLEAITTQIGDQTASSCLTGDCPFSRSFVFLSLCIRGFPWVSDDLLKYHGAEQITELAHWSRATGDEERNDQAIPESMSFDNYHRLVLVEPNRTQATFQCVDAVKRLCIRELILFFDWRVLEDWRDVESKESLIEPSHHKHILQGRFFGFTCWLGDQVVFLHRDVVKMPESWLEK